MCSSVCYMWYIFVRIVSPTWNRVRSIKNTLSLSKVCLINILCPQWKYFLLNTCDIDFDYVVVMCAQTRAKGCPWCGWGSQALCPVLQVLSVETRSRVSSSVWLSTATRLVTPSTMMPPWDNVHSTPLIKDLSTALFKKATESTWNGIVKIVCKLVKHCN